MLVAIAVLAMSAGIETEAACVATARDIAAGEHISADMLEPVDCRAKGLQPRRLRFDPMTRSAKTDAALPAGTYLGRLLVSDQYMLPKGTRVTLRAASGPAFVERQVTTLQSARSGQRVFVRDDSGNVFAVELVVSDGARQAK